jgi:thiol-disulfide isomerase/thioredoxin
VSKRLLSVVAAAVLLLTASGCSSFHGLNGTDGKTWVQGDGAPKQIAIADRGEPVDFSGDDLDGKQLSLASMRGKPTVVNVWWAGCPPCRAEAPKLVGAQKELGDRAHFVGIDVRDGGTAAPQAYEEQFGIDWPSFYSPGGEALLAFPGAITPNSIPSTVVLDADGRVAASIIGALPSQLTLVEIVKQVAAGG